MTNGAACACVYLLSAFTEPEWISTTMNRQTTNEGSLVVSYGMRWRTNEVFRISTDEGFFIPIRRTFEGPLVAITNTTARDWQAMTGTNPPTSLPPHAYQGVSSLKAPVNLPFSPTPLIALPPTKYSFTNDPLIEPKP